MDDPKFQTLPHTCSTPAQLHSCMVHRQALPLYHCAHGTQQCLMGKPTAMAAGHLIREGSATNTIMRHYITRSRLEESQLGTCSRQDHSLNMYYLKILWYKSHYDPEIGIWNEIISLCHYCTKHIQQAHILSETQDGACTSAHIYSFQAGHNTWQLTHWGRATHICVGKLTIIVSNNGLSPGWRQAIIWTIAGILLIGLLGTNFSEILIRIQTFSLKKMHLKMASAKWRPFVSASMF